MKEGKDGFVLTDDSNSLVVRSGSTSAKCGWIGEQSPHRQTPVVHVLLSRKLISHLGLLKSKRMTVKGMKSTLTTPLKSEYESKHDHSVL